MDLLISNVATVSLGDCILSTILGLVLHLPLLSARAVVVNIEFARLNFSIFLEHFMKLILTKIFGQISNENISILVKIGILLMRDDDLSSIDGSVLACIEASLGLLRAVEVEVAIALRLVGLLVDNDSGVREFVTLREEVLI